MVEGFRGVRCVRGFGGDFGEGAAHAGFGEGGGDVGVAGGAGGGIGVGVLGCGFLLGQEYGGCEGGEEDCGARFRASHRIKLSHAWCSHV